MPKTERLLQHDVLDAASTSDHGPPADQCNRGGIKVGLKVRPITSVTLSDGRGPGERALTRRSVLEQPLRSGPFGARRTVSSVKIPADG
jgi:hypothetical protein